MNDKQFATAMETIVAALKERGYDPYAQLTGCITENEPTYITNHEGARQLIIDKDLFEEHPNVKYENIEFLLVSNDLDVEAIKTLII